LYNPDTDPPAVWYPTGVIDRVSGILSRGSWYSTMNNRNNVPASVDIGLNWFYNQVTREFQATLRFTALKELTGQFRFSVILSEDGLVWTQAGPSGGDNYVHDWTVRAMMNRPLGDEIINGTWSSGQQITRNLTFTYPVPPAPAPDITPENCRITVLVYKMGSPIYSNAEVQQAQQWDWFTQDYFASIVNKSSDAIAPNNSPIQYRTVLYNEGLLTDGYDLSLNIDGPPGWSGEFTTVNGTFPAGQSDFVTVNVGDSTEITVTLNPNSVDGYGSGLLGFVSSNNPGLSETAACRLVTQTGIDYLVVDATDGQYGDYLISSLNKFVSGSFGLVSRSALHKPTSSVDSFKTVFWSSGNVLPAFYPEEVTILQNYLDSGGNLFICGQDIGSDIFGVGGQSQFAQGFYTSYLHANFLNEISAPKLITGYSGDPITNLLVAILSDIYTSSPDVITGADAQATPILKYMTGPDVTGIRVSTGNFKVVYLALGFEQIRDEPNRDSLLVRSMRWFNESVTALHHDELKIRQFCLAQNYPNPFNPETRISYILNSMKPEPTRLIIFNSLGQPVKILVDGYQTAGDYEVTWDGRDDSGRQISSGIYYYQLTSGKEKATQKMILLR
jgi:hypothetical protein